jgi:HK97 gp10 family phage protein
VTILNRGEFFKKLERRLGIVPIKNAERACYKAANLVKNEAVKSILGGAKTGKTSKKYNPNRTHTASAPGESPASDTGALAKGIFAEVKTSKAAKEVAGIVRATAPYSAHLEFGTRNMAARPYLQPALDKSAQRIIGIFKKEGIIS